MTSTTLGLKGMSCASCANSIEAAIQQVLGVTSAQVNFAAKQASVEYDRCRTSLEAIQSAVAEAGYEASEQAIGIRKEVQEQKASKVQQSHYIQHPPKSVLRLHLQRRRHSHRRRYSLPHLWLAIEPHHRRGGDGF